MKKFVWIALGALVVAAALAGAGLLMLRFGREPDGAERMALVRGEFGARKVNGSNWVVPPSKRPDVVKRVKSALPVATDDGEELTEAEEKFVDTIRAALDEEDLELSIELAKQAVRSKKAEVRSEMVDVLRFFGDKVLPELLTFADDPDEGVRMEAMSAYEQAIFDIEDDREKAQIVEISMRNLHDADALEEIAMELIGMDDRLAVQTLVNVIGGDSEIGRRIAKETYETVTGEEYTTFEAAEAWLREQ